MIEDSISRLTVSALHILISNFNIIDIDKKS